MTSGRNLPPFPPKAEWDRAPRNRWTFQHVREIVPTVDFWRGTGPDRVLPRDERDLDQLAVFCVDGSPSSLAFFLDQTYTVGLLVLKNCSISYERYFNGL